MFCCKCSKTMVLLSQPSKVHEMNTYKVDANLAYCLSQAFFFYFFIAESVFLKPARLCICLFDAVSQIKCLHELTRALYTFV